MQTFMPYSDFTEVAKVLGKGKVWQGLGPLKNHLAQFKHIPSEWIVMEIEQIIKSSVPAKVIYPVPNKSAYVTPR